MIEINQLELEHNKLLCDLLRLDSDGVEQFRLLAGFIPTEESLVRQIWGDPDCESDLVLGAFINGNLVGFSIAVRRPWKSGREDSGFIKWIYISPKHRRQGIGSRLLQRTESVMRSHGVTELIYGSSAPRYLWSGVATQDLATQGVLDRQGWACGSERINLTLSLPTTMHLIWPTMLNEIEMRFVASSDFNNLKAFIIAEFSESWWREVESIFQSEQTYCKTITRIRDEGIPAPQIPLITKKWSPRDLTPEAFGKRLEEKSFGMVACRNGEIIGFAATHATNPNWFGPMGIHHSERGKGIGRQLLLKSVREATVRGSKLLTIPWVNEEFYNKCLGKLTRQVFVKYSKCV